MDMLVQGVKQKRINQWLRKQLYTPDGPPQLLVLRHLVAGNKIGGEVARYKIEGDFDNDRIVELISQISADLECDADGLESHQKYALLAFTQDNVEPRARIIVHQTATMRDEFGDPLDTEDQSSRGIMAQQMRHNEIFMKVAVGSASTSLSAANRQIGMLMEQNEKLHEKVMEFTSLMEELRSQKHERDLEVKQAEFSMELKSDMVKKILMLAPVVVNKFAGVKLMTEKMSPTEMALAAFVNSLKPEQFENLLGVLTPEQQIVVSNMVEHFATEELKNKNGVS